MNKLKETLKNLKKKITLFAVVMLALQPVLGLAALPAKTFASVSTTGSHEVVINEIAWAGSTASSNDEWIELYNTTASSIDITDWRIEGAATSGSDLTISDGIIPAHGYFLIANYAANSESSTLNVTPDMVDSSLSLSNSGAQYTLYDDTDNIIDTADDGSGVPLAGENGIVKKSMERNRVIADGTLATSWHTATTSVGFDAEATEMGTPKSLNSLSDVTPPVVTGVEDGHIYNVDVTPIFTEGTGHLSLNGGIAPTWESGKPVHNDGVYILTVTDAAGNETVVHFTIDQTLPDFTLATDPIVAGPGVKTVKITVGVDGPLAPQPATSISTGGREVHALGGTWELKLTIHDLEDPLVVYLDSSNINVAGKYEYIYNIGDFVGKKTVNFDAEGTDLAGNYTMDPSGSFGINNLVLSPVIPPTSTVVTAVATTPVVDEQFGGSSSDQGEVKADTTIKKDEQKPDDNNQKTETKDKKNIPLWGIIFLLILAGIGGYLFYSQSPEKSNGKK